MPLHTNEVIFFVFKAKNLITLETVKLYLARRTLINVLSLPFIKYLFKAGYLNLKQDTGIPKALEKAV